MAVVTNAVTPGPAKALNDPSDAWPLVDRNRMPRETIWA
jgi:hypothetical protein